MFVPLILAAVFGAPVPAADAAVAVESPDTWIESDREQFGWTVQAAAASRLMTPTVFDRAQLWIRVLPAIYEVQTDAVFVAFDLRGSVNVPSVEDDAAPLKAPPKRHWFATQTSFTFQDFDAAVRAAFHGDEIAATAKAKGFSRPSHDYYSLWPDPYVVAATIPVRREVADEEQCPALGPALRRFSTQLAEPVAVTGLGPDMPLMQSWDGSEVTVGYSGVLTRSHAGGAGTMTSSNSPMAAWAYQTLKAIQDCWRPEPDPHP